MKNKYMITFWVMFADVCLFLLLPGIFQNLNIISLRLTTVNILCIVAVIVPIIITILTKDLSKTYN